MNKAVKIILAIAIGLLYPIVIFLLILTILPDYKESESSRAPTLNYNECRSKSSSSRTSTIDYDCEKRFRDQYDKDIKKYQSDKKQGLEETSKVMANRIKMALVFVIVGFIIALAVKAVSAVSAGLAGGSTVILMTASGYAVASTGHIDLINELLFLLVFIMLIGLLFIIDVVFPKLPAVEEPKPELTEKNNEVKK